MLLPLLLALYGVDVGFIAVVLLICDAHMLIDVSDYLLTILLGSQFPVQVLPAILLPISLALPLTYGFDATHGLLFQTETLLPMGLEIVIPPLFMEVTVPLGYLIFQQVERRIKRLGTLGMH